jgi:hypothetical protein
MRANTLFLSGATALAFALSVPALAQSESTPAEKAQTQNLNTQVLNDPGAPTAADQAAYDAAMTKYNAEVQQYQEKLGDYSTAKAAHDNAEDAYHDRVQDYHAEKNAYRENSQSYGRALDPDPAPRDFSRLDYPGDRRDLAELQDVRMANFSSAPVEDSTGHIVGSVRRVEERGDSRVAVALDNHGTVWVRYPHLRYDREKDVLLSDLSYDELAHMPAAN